MIKHKMFPKLRASQNGILTQSNGIALYCYNRQPIKKRMHTHTYDNKQQQQQRKQTKHNKQQQQQSKKNLLKLKRFEWQWVWSKCLNVGWLHVSRLYMQERARQCFFACDFWFAIRSFSILGVCECVCVCACFFIIIICYLFCSVFSFSFWLEFWFSSSTWAYVVCVVVYYALFLSKCHY